MPNISRNKRFSKAAKDSVFGAAIAASIEDPSKLQNAIDFIEGPGGIGIVLRPVQRVIVKSIYGVPFDYKPEWTSRIEGWGKVPMYDIFREKKLYDVTEEEYLRIAFNEGRCNVADWREVPNMGGNPGEAGFNEACIFAGRRGGKSELVAAIASYKLYLLLNIRCPQEHFGLFPGSIIDFTFLAQDENGAHRLFKKLREQVLKAESFFAPYLKDTNAKDLAFVTLADREKQDSTPTVTVSCLPCLEEHELIWKADGLAEIGKINIGDVVLDAHANKQRVIHKQYNEKEVLALETANFRNDPLLLTPNHTCIFVSETAAKSALPYLIDRDGRSGAIDSRAKIRFAKKPQNIRWEEGPASRVEAGGFLLFPRISEDKRKSYMIDNADAVTLPYTAYGFGHQYVRQQSGARVVPAFQISPLVCRLWGLYLAEGSISHNNAGVNWDFHINEKNTYAKFVQDTLMSEFGLPSQIVNKEGKGCRVMCGSVQLARGFMRVFGHGCVEKSIPGEALYWPVDCQKALIQGWLEGDGCDNRAVGPTVSKKLAYSLFAIGVQAGLLPSVKRRPAYTDKKGVPHRQSWYVNFNKQERYYRFFQRVGDQEFYWSKVLSNSATGKTVRVVDISVENTESFLTKFAAVHNCTTNAVRSPSSIFLALDEFAHFRSAKGSTSDDMYAAASPSTADFHHDKVVKSNELPEREMGTDFGEESAVRFEEDAEPGIEFEDANEVVGMQDSMILSISSPLKKIGKMYELHKLALDEGVNSGIFTLNCPSAEMNPKLLSKFLKSEYKKNPLTFRAEYGGKFLESSESYVTEAAVKKCTDCAWDEKGLPVEGSARLNIDHFTQQQIGRNYFWGFDLGMTNDASALAIAHLEPGGPGGTIRLVFDYINRMMVGENGTWPGVKSVPGQEKYAGYQVLPLEDILAWMHEMNKILPCFKGATDQHGGQQLVQMLELKKIRNFELVNITPAINSQMAYALRGYIESERCTFPYVPKFIQELKLVELEVTAKYRIRVAAPQEKGAHDDMSDAAMLCAFLAQRWLLDQGQMMDPSGLSLLVQAQASRPPAPLVGMDGIPMQVLKIMEKLKKAQQYAASYSGANPVSPWSRKRR